MCIRDRCTTSLYIPVEKLSQFQELVKAHNLRFVGNPFVMPRGKEAYVSVSSDDAGMEAHNAFWSAWYQMNTPIRETVRKPRLMTRFRRLFRKVFSGKVHHAC